MKKKFHKCIAATAAVAMTLMQCSLLPSMAFPERGQQIRETLQDATETITEAETEATYSSDTMDATEETTELLTDTSEATEAETTPATDVTEESTSETATEPTEAATDEVTEASSDETTEASSEELTEAPTAEPTEEPTEETTEDPAYASMPDYSRLGAIGTFSQAMTQELAERIYLGMYHHDASVDLTTLESGRVLFETDKESLKNLFYTVAYSTRYGVLVDLHMHYHYVQSYVEPWYLSDLTLTYSVPDMVYDAAFEDVEEKIDAILALVDPTWSDPEKALFLHDYFCIHYNYDYERLYNPSLGSECYTAYGLLINNTAVCHGYAWLYNILMNDLGIESYFVSSAENNHAWNILRLDGNYYHIDCTYDDCEQRTTSQFGLAGQVDHASFLKPHTAMISSGHKCSQYDWVLSTGELVWTTDNSGVHVPGLPTDNRFNEAFWNNTRTGIYPYNGGWLVKEPDPNNLNAACYNLYYYHNDESESEWVQTILTDGNSWYADAEHTRTTPNYSTCVVDDDIIYYTTNSGSTVMAVTHRPGGNQYDYVWVWLFNLPEEKQAAGNIFGMKIEGDTLYYQVAPTFRKTPVEFKCDITAYREQVHAAAGAQPQGDLNGDNQLDVLDVVGMARYLSGVDTVEDIETRKRLDLVEDGVLDIFDFAMLKKIVIEQS